MKITKDELITKITEKTEGMSKAQVNSVVTATFNTIADIMAAGDKISVPQFGTFGSAERAERTGKNPATGEAIRIPAVRKPKFVAGTYFREIVNKYEVIKDEE